MRLLIAAIAGSNNVKDGSCNVSFGLMVIYDHDNEDDLSHDYNGS